VYISPSNPGAVIFDNGSPGLLYLPYAIGTHGAHSDLTVIKHNWGETARQHNNFAAIARQRKL